jgi:NADH-quinone oxidoreductase subunit N
MLAALLQIPVTANDSIATPHVEWRALAPTLVLIGGAVVLLVVGSLSRRKPPNGVYALWTVVTAIAAMIFAFPLWRDVTNSAKGPFTAVRGAIGVDGFSVFVTFVICIAVVLAALLADGYLRRERMDGVELYVLMLLSASGGLVMASANDLIVVFLGLEILSIAAYVLAAMHLRRVESQEAGMKYFVLGAFSSAFFLYGIALIYGAVGSTNLAKIAQAVPSVKAFDSSGVTAGQLLDTGHTPALLLAGFALLLVGFGFKVAAAPFHSWTPDVYQGAPSPTTAFMASAVKVAGFAALLRVFVGALGGFKADWQPFVYALAVATLLVGSVLAIVQTDVKRMLAYSSISHAGFVLVGVQAASDKGVAGALFYLAAYTFMVAGSFGVVTLVSRRGDSHTALDDYKGLAKREPLLAFVFTVFLLAQAGVPLTSGFFAKFYVLAAAIDAGYWHLGVIAMLSAVIAAFLYLRIVVTMYMSDEVEDEQTEAAELAARGPRLPIPFGAKIALGLAFIATLVFGFLPEPLAASSRDATPVVTAQAK